MTKYRGYYIDGVYFNSEREIDTFLKTQAVERYQKLVTKFVNDSSMELSIMISNEALNLHNLFNMDWDEIEALEIEAIKAAA